MAKPHSTWMGHLKMHSYRGGKGRKANHGRAAPELGKRLPQGRLEVSVLLSSLCQPRTCTRWTCFLCSVGHTLSESLRGDFNPDVPEQH